MMALSGIRVLELGHWVAAPGAAAILCDWGADVIKVEHPRIGDSVRGLVAVGYFESDLNWGFELVNGGKRGIGVDVTSPEGREIILKLVAQCDVFVSNLQLGVIEKLGFDYEMLSKINSRLVYCGISGYGEKGPDRDVPAFDEIAFWARSGIMNLLGEPDTPPVPLHGAIGDLTTAMFAAGGIALALFARERTGEGQKVELSLLNSGTWVAGWDLQRALTLNKDIFRQSRKTQISPLYNSYQTKDGRWLQFVMPQPDRYWAPLCRALGREDLAADPRFSSFQALVVHSQEAIAVIDEVIGSFTLAELARRFEGHDLVWGVARNMIEVISDPQVVQNEYVVEYDHPNYGRQKTVASPVKLTKMPARPRTSAPEHGQHTEEVLLELGYDWETIEDLKKKKAII